jgi:hypothetical protein
VRAIPVAAAVTVLLVQQSDQHEATAAAADRRPRWRRHRTDTTQERPATGDGPAPPAKR